MCETFFHFILNMKFQFNAWRGRKTSPEIFFFFTQLHIWGKKSSDVFKILQIFFLFLCPEKKKKNQMNDNKSSDLWEIL